MPAPAVCLIATTLNTPAIALPTYWSAGGFNKGWLVDLLRKHPNWDEDALAITHAVTATRELDMPQVLHLEGELFRLASAPQFAGEELARFRAAISLLTHSYSQYIADGSVAEEITRLTGISCAVGQKASRIINKICKSYGVDKHERYNAYFAALADALNPIKIPRTALLSAHPCDYLEMSNVSNSWGSCHNLGDGAYRAGTLSYLTDACSLIFYTVDCEKYPPIYTSPKATREVFCYGNGVLLQSRLYPATDDIGTMTTYRNLVQQSLAACLSVPNLWALHSEDGCVGTYVETCSYAEHYRDYEYACYHPTVSLLTDVYPGQGAVLTVGDKARCLCCASSVASEGDMHCTACGDIEYCSICDDRIHGSNIHWIGDTPYCSDCVDYCDMCEAYTINGVTTVYTANSGVCACPTCIDEYAHTCDECEELYLLDSLEQVEDEYLCPHCVAARDETRASA